MRIGLFFGSFNPIHTGHLIIANHILNEVKLDKIWFVVSPVNPFKINSDLLDETARLALVDLAVQNDERIDASDVEFQLSKPSFTINTLLFLRNAYPDHEFSIIMGSDNFHNLDKWKDYEKIIANYKLLIYLRTGFGVKNNLKADIEVMKAPILDLSSTEIRELIEKGKSIRYLVPEIVRMEIERKRYYKK